MLKDIILSALVSTPLGLAMVAGIGWLIRYGWRWARRWREALKDAAEEDPEDYDPEAVYR